MDFIGIAVVFILLLIIVFLIFLIFLIAVMIRKTMKNNSEKAQAAGSSAPSWNAGEVINNANEIMNTEIGMNTANADYELISVITAAIAMVTSSNGGDNAPYPGFKVRSIRRIRFYNNNSN